MTVATFITDPTLSLTWGTVLCAIGILVILSVEYAVSERVIGALSYPLYFLGIVCLIAGFASLVLSLLLLIIRHFLSGG